MNKRINGTIALAFILMTFLATTAKAQDCSRYQILDLRDTVVQGNPCVSFLMTIDTLMFNNTGYTSLFFLDAAGDTLNPLTWSELIPDTSAARDTVHQILNYVFPGVSSFPQNFNGYLMMRNPNCDIPFQRGTVGIEERNERKTVLYPNPSNGWVTISMDEGTKDIDRVEVLDVLGQRLLLSAFSGVSNIDLTGISPGYYTVLAWSGPRLLFTKTLIMQ